VVDERKPLTSSITLPSEFSIALMDFLPNHVASCLRQWRPFVMYHVDRAGRAGLQAFLEAAVTPKNICQYVICQCPYNVSSKVDRSYGKLLVIP
jgi:hypothetical protein